jgi:hypothetical protein
MCAEFWVRQRCLQNASDLWNAETLLDPMISSKQAQRLLHLICYPDTVLPEEGLDPRSHIPRLMESLDQWNLREALLTLTLQNRQLTNSGNAVDHGNWLDVVARAALDVFNLSTDDGFDYSIPIPSTTSPAPGKSPRSGKKGQPQTLDIVAKTPPSNSVISNPLSISSASSSSFGGSGSEGSVKSGTGNVGNTSANDINKQLEDMEVDDPTAEGWTPTAAWLLAPLVTKLSSAVQGRVLRNAG